MHSTEQAKSAGQTIIESMHVISPTHSILHVPSLHPAVHSGGHSPPGGEGSSTHSPGPVLPEVAAPVEPDSVVDVDAEELALDSALVVASDDPDASDTPVEAAALVAPAESSSPPEHAARRMAIATLRAQAMRSG